MPPPMGHNPMPYGSQGKVPQSMMGGPQMGSYSQPYSTQGTFLRGGKPPKVLHIYNKLFDSF